MTEDRRRRRHIATWRFFIHFSLSSAVDADCKMIKTYVSQATKSRNVGATVAETRQVLVGNKCKKNVENIILKIITFSVNFMYHGSEYKQYSV